MPILMEFRYHSPSTLSEALSLLKKAKSPLLLAGGTFVLNYLKKASKYPSDVISLKKIPQLKGIRETNKDLSIGAMTMITELAESNIIRDRFQSLFQASQKLGTTPIRNMATIGGNLASRFFWVDLPTVLISLDAKLTVATSKGREVITVEEFLNHKPLKNFIIESISLSKKERMTHYFRHTKSMEVDMPSLALAFSACWDESILKEVRLVVNTALSFPVALKNAEGVFEGKDPKRIVMASVKEALHEDLKKTKLDDYRRHCLEADCQELIVLLKRA